MEMRMAKNQRLPNLKGTGQRVKNGVLSIAELDE